MFLFNFFTDDGEVSATSMSYTHPLFSSHGYQMVNSYHNVTDEKLYKVLIRHSGEFVKLSDLSVNLLGNLLFPNRQKSFFIVLF